MDSKNIQRLEFKFFLEHTKIHDIDPFLFVYLQDAQRTSKGAPPPHHLANGKGKS